MNELELIKAEDYYSRNDLAEIFHVSPTHIANRFKANGVKEIAHVVKGNEKRIYIQGIDIINAFKKNPDFLKKKRASKKKYGISELPKITDPKKMTATLFSSLDDNNKEGLTKDKSMWTVLNYLYDTVKEMNKSIEILLRNSEHNEETMEKVKKEWGIK